MNTNNKNKNYFMVLVVILFLIFSYLILKSFFEDNYNSNTIFNKNGLFSFIYDSKILNSKELDEMYDENRTNRVVAERNYARETLDNKKGKLFLNPSKMEYYFYNLNDKYYKFSINDINYLSLYNLNEDSNIVYFAILGSDLKYYTISMAIFDISDDIDINNKEWQKNNNETLGVYHNLYYKVIDEYCCIQVSFPVLLNDEKYSESEYNKLIDKIEKSISFEEVDEMEYNYYSFKQDNIKLSNKVTLLIKDSKISQFYSINNDTLSYTVMTYIYSDKLVKFYDIDDKDSYNFYLRKNNYNLKEYDYKGIKTYLIYQNPSTYDSILFDIDDHYYKIELTTPEVVDDSSIDTWITNNIQGILEIN